jgi:1-acyl-sn-glycerol-3-phosphate acyltransferase
VEQDIVSGAGLERKHERAQGRGLGSAGAIARAVWGVAADVAIILYTVVLAPPLIAVALISPGTADRIALVWCRLILWTAAARVEAAGMEHLPQRGPCILVANHQSYFDICGLVSVLGAPPRFVTKKELARIPVFGGALRALGEIIIDRADPESAKQAIQEAARSLPGVIRICFFAEGTRSADGGIGPFKKGAVALGCMTGLPLVPVSISGTRKFMRKGGILVRPCGRIRIVFGQPITTQGVPLDERDALNEQLRDFVIREFDPSF